MEALILSCSTGGGHNAAGRAVGKELKRRGHGVTYLDPYELQSEKLAETVGGVYVKIAQRMPFLFGFIYLLGEIYRRLPVLSPVYYVNKKPARLLEEYLNTHPVDVIIMPHLFPAEIITYMRKHGKKLPLTVFIATDYTCIPFTEETECDYYILPGREQRQEFIKRGIPAEKLISFGIPTDKAFREQISKEEAKKRLGLSEEKRYILVAGGSIGAGGIERAVSLIAKYLRSRKNVECIIICGNNKHLYDKMSKVAGCACRNRHLANALHRDASREDKMILIRTTRQMALYLKACDVFLSKPGGLSSTEAAVAGIPLIHISPIPGCELKNQGCFQKHHMCIAVKNMHRQLIPALHYAMQEENVDKMRRAQETYINHRACEDICGWLESRVTNPNSCK